MLCLLENPSNYLKAIIDNCFHTQLNISQLQSTHESESPIFFFSTIIIIPITSRFFQSTWVECLHLQIFYTHVWRISSLTLIMISLSQSSPYHYLHYCHEKKKKNLHHFPNKASSSISSHHAPSQTPYMSLYLHLQHLPNVKRKQDLISRQCTIRPSPL